MEPEHIITNENNNPPLNPIEQISPLKRVVNKIKNLLIQIFTKIKTRWLSLPLKFRIAISPLLIIILILGIYTLTLNKIGSLDELKRITQEDIVKQFSEGWTKLEVPQREISFFSLQPQTEGKFGILPKETFILTSQKAVSESFIRENLKSNIPVTITTVSAKEFRITTEGGIGNDKMVTLSLPVKNGEVNGHTFDRNYGWTFQAQGKFRVTTSIPGNEKTNVPLNTGIEITFSQDDYKDPKNLISITPSIEWRGERHSETYSIIPLKPLDPKTLYTVTLKNGLNLESRNDPITQDHSFSFQTQELTDVQKIARPPRLSLGNNFIQTSPNEPPAVPVHISNWTDDLSLKIKVYKFNNSDQFIESRKRVDEVFSSWYSYFAENEQVTTDTLAKVSEIDLKVQKKDNTEYIQLPEPFSKGSYLVQLWYEDGKKLEQLWVQSTNISAYTSVGRKQTLIWVNNVSSGDPMRDAKITPVDSGYSYSTSDNGIAVFGTPQVFFDNSVHYIKVSAGDEVLILPINSLQGSAQAQDKNPNDYWSYLYHERILYKPGDTVYFWGVVKERDTGYVPSEIEVNISKGYHYSYSDETSSLTIAKIAPDPAGTFIGNIPLTNIPEGYYSLSLKVNGIQITQSGLQITEYEKPEMKIEVTPNKKAIFSTEKVDFTATVSFFDGTPAKQIPLNIYTSSYARGDKTEVITDEKGEIKYTYEPKYGGSDQRYPRYESITLNPTLAQGSNIEGFGSVFVYGSKLMITSTSSQEGSKAFLKATVNKVDLGGINQGKSSDTGGGVVSDKEVGLNITKTWWEKIETGTYYDFIEKQTRPSYRYKRHDEKLVETKLKTNSAGEIVYEFDMEKGKSYQLTLSADDEDKHTAQAREYYYHYDESQSYTPDEYAVPELTLDSKENSFSVNENVKLTIKYKGENYPETDKNRFLFILAQRGKQDFFVRNNPEFDFRFDNKHIPNIYAAAVIFTGKLYQTASPQCTWDWQCSYGYYYDDYYFNSLAIHYRQEDSSLELNIEPDKERYQPGDVAKISVTVKKNKLPTPNAQVNLILVDQALEAIGGVKKPSVLGSLYKTVPNEIYYNYNSHKPVFNISPASERGGGGGEDRQIFKDTPFFGQTRTNEEGVATFEFTLSDNITTWLIYAQSLSGNFDAGQAEGRLIASKDFFVTSNFPKEYLQKDTSFITGNGFGESIGQNQTISYEARIFKGENELHKLAGDGKALKDTSFQLPGLNTGDYRVWLKGTTNDLVDGVIYPFSVIQSRLDLQMENKFKIEKGMTLNSIELAGLNNQKPIKMIITDAGRGQYYYQLYNFCFTSSNRIEKKLAKTTANSIINERFAEEPCKARVDELSAFQNFDGGISQVSWGGSDLETTVWAIYVNKDAFDKDKLTAYLEDELNRTRTGSVQKIYAYWGLTLLGKPHINELLFFAQNSTEFDERVISALALASIGETEVSRDIYFDLLADYAYTNKPYIRIQSKTNVGSHALIDKYVYDTSLALLLGSIVEKNYNEGLYLYLRDYQNQVEDIVLDLGKISFINEELGKLPLEDTQVFFRSNLRQETFDLSKGRQKSINLLKDEIDNVSISVNLGKADVGVFYYATADIFSQMKKDKRLSIKREIKKIKSDNDPIRPGDIIQVKIDFDLNTLNAPLGGYTITDHLPSGLTYIENPGIYGFTQKGWVWQDTNNVIRYVFYNSPWWQNYGEHSFTYFARASAVGTYTAEPCIIQSRLDLSVIQSTPEEVIKIESSD